MRETILVIEDNEKIAMALQIRIRSWGYGTLVAHDAIAGSSMAVQHKPNLILLDISMPAGNGLDLAANLQKLPETQQIPIIFITASKDPKLLEKVTDLNAVGLFEKPFDIEALLHLAQETLEKKRRYATATANVK